MTAESATAAHDNIVVPDGDAANGNITASSKKSRESDRRRRRRKQKKNKKSSHADVEDAEASDSKKKADPQQQVIFVSLFSHSSDWRFSRVCD